MLARSSTLVPPMMQRGAISLIATRMMSIDPSAGVPKAPFMRPKGIEWSDRSGNPHVTSTVKPKMAIFTGDPDERMPVDPYAPEITPSQIRKLSDSEKSKVTDMTRRLRAMAKGAYDNVDQDVDRVVRRAKTQEKRSEFSSMLRDMNPQAYAKVEAESEQRKAHNSGAKRMAGLLRAMNPQAYAKVDPELGGCPTSGVPKFEYRRNAKGVDWADAGGGTHHTKMVKKKIGFGGAEDGARSPIDPYRADAA